MNNIRLRIRVIAQITAGNGVDELHTPAAALRDQHDITLTRVFPRSSTVQPEEHAKAIMAALTDTVADKVSDALFLYR